MNRFFLLFVNLLILMSFNEVIYAQGELDSSTGRVLDRKTYAPIDNVNIYTGGIQGIAVTNSKGEFDIKLLHKYDLKDTICFSCVGYTTIKISLKELRKSKYKVLLSEKIIPIDEVVSYAKPLQLYLEYEKKAHLPNGGIAFFASILFKNEILLEGGDISEIKPVPFGFKAGSYVGGKDAFESYSPYLYRYNLDRDTWSRLNLTFKARAYHGAYFYNNSIYILGGKLLSINRKIEYLDDVIEVYDMQRDTILIDYMNPHKATSFASCLYKDYLIVAGGSISKNTNEKKIYSNKVHLFNLKTGLWYELADMPYGKESKGILCDHYFYLFGGYRNEPLKKIECYDILSGKWRDVGNLPFAVERPAIACLDKIVYLFERGNMFVYNLITGTTFVYRIDLDLTGSEMYCVNKKLYIVGGCEKGGDTFIPSRYVYTVSLSEFDKTEEVTQQSE